MISSDLFRSNTNGLAFWPTVWSERLGLLGILLFSFSIWLSAPLANLALLLMLLAMGLQWQQSWRVLRADSLFWPLLAVMMYLVIRGLIAGYEFPDYADAQWEYVYRFGMLGMFWVVAYWCRGEYSRIRIMLALSLAGMLLGLALNQDWSQWQQMLAGQRSGKHLWNEIIMGLFAATALLGVLLYWQSFINSNSARKRLIGAAIWGMLIIIFAQAVIVSQSRNVWLACLLVYPLVLMLYLRRQWKTTSQSGRKQLLVTSVAGLFVLVVMLVLNADAIGERVVKEKAVVGQLIEQDAYEPEDIPHSSIGYRVLVFIHGIEAWLDRPWFGWGPGVSSTKQLTLEYGRQDIVDLKLSHLHNGYLEILVRGGVIALLLSLIVLWLVIKGAHEAYRRDEMSLNLYLLFCGAMLMSLIWSMTEFRLHGGEFRFYWFILAGIGYSWAIKRTMISQNIMPTGSTA